MWFSLNHLTWGNIVSGIIAALIFSGLGFLLKGSIDKFREFTRGRKIRAFFRLRTQNKVYIIHPAVLNIGTPPQAYPLYPSVDTKAARAAARVLEKTGRIEGRDYEILDDQEAVQRLRDEIWNNDLIFIGGPKHNSLVRQVWETLNHSPEIRYKCEFDSGQNQWIIFDKTRGAPLPSTQDNPPQPLPSETYDHGLILSVYNAMHNGRNIVILCGIHHQGTLGAAEFISDEKNLAKILPEEYDNPIQQALRVDYDGEKIVRVTPS